MRHPFRRSRSLTVLALIIALCLQVLPTASLAQEQPPAQDEEILPAFVPGQLIIAFQPWVTEDEIAEFYQEYNLTHMDDVQTIKKLKETDWYLSELMVDCFNDNTDTEDKTMQAEAVGKIWENFQANAKNTNCKGVTFIFNDRPWYGGDSSVLEAEIINMV